MSPAGAFVNMGIRGCCRADRTEKVCAGVDLSGRKLRSEEWMDSVKVGASTIVPLPFDLCIMSETNVYA